MPKRTALALAWTALVLGVAGAFAQTGGSTYSTTVQPIFDRECVKCHGPKEKKAKLDLSPGESYKALVNVPSKEVSGTLRVKPGEPDQSYLWLKLEHRASEGEGMPRGLFFSKNLSQKDMEAIKAWIAAGAAP